MKDEPIPWFDVTSFANQQEFMIGLTLVLNRIIERVNTLPRPTQLISLGDKG